MTAILFLLAEEIVIIILGEQFTQAINVLRILAFLPLLSSFTTIFTVNILIPLNLQTEFMKTFVIAGICSVITALILVPHYSFYGTAIALLLAELIAASISYWFVKRNVNLFN